MRIKATSLNTRSIDCLEMKREGQEDRWWLASPASLLDELRASPAGLTSTEARARLKRYGPNQFRDRPERPPLVQFLRRFRNPLVLILIAASIVSALTGEMASFVIIVAMVLMSVVLDFVREYHAGQAVRRLRQSVQIRATVLRDGAAKEVRRRTKAVDALRAERCEHRLRVRSSLP